MGHQAGHIVFIGTIGNLCFYKSCGQYCIRKSSSLTGKRVKKDKAFIRTMENAGILARASKIGSAVYRELPKTFRQFWMYKAFTGEVIQWLRQGKTDEEARMILWKTYAEVWAKEDPVVVASEVKQTTDAQNVATDKKQKGTSISRTSRKCSDEIMPDSGKYKRENTISPVIALLSSQRMVRRRRIRRA